MTTTITETQSADAPVHAEEIDEHDRPTGHALCDLGDGEFVDGPLANSSWQITCEKCLAWHDEPTASASEYAHQICPPQDHQPAQPHRPARKPGAFNSTVRRLHNLRLIAERVNAPAGILTVAARLAERGAPADLIRRYASPVGRKVAAAWRNTTGTEPEQRGLAVSGRRLVWAAGYRADDRALIDSVIDAYEMPDPSAPKSRKAPRVRLLDLITNPAPIGA